MIQFYFPKAQRPQELAILDNTYHVTRASGKVDWPPTMPIPVDSTSGTTASYSAENRQLLKRTIIFSDTDNDVVCVENTLRFAGIINKRGEISGDIDGLSIVHTGDLVDKRNPDPSVVGFWESLRLHASRRGCAVKFLAGNHEMEAWQRIMRGETFDLPGKSLTRVRHFIEGLDLFHVDGAVLFLHGYPTLGFLRTLLHFHEVTGKEPSHFNEDHFRRAFRSAEAIRQYAYVKGKAGGNYLLGNVAEASGYYKKHGRNVATLLRELDIRTIIHGHRPQRSGKQVDHEFARWIPGVRMISNDINVRARGMGATAIRMRPRQEPEVVFIHTQADYKKTRKRVRRLLHPRVAVPLAPPAAPVEISRSAKADPKELVSSSGLPLVQAPSTPEPIATAAIEVAVAPASPPVGPPSNPKPGRPLVEKTTPSLPGVDSVETRPSSNRMESTSRYRHRFRSGWNISVATLAVTLVVLGIYWFKEMH